MNPAIYFRCFIAWTLSLPALLMPYSVRMGYIHFLSVLIHLPLKMFGKIAHFLLRELDIRPRETELEKSSFPVPHPEGMKEKVCILYSGGTDSTCVTAIAAQTFREIHLLTFSEKATRNSPLPTRNIELLKKKYPQAQISFFHYDIDEMVRFLSFENYFARFRRHGPLVLATCAYSSLSWHLSTIRHCRKNGITEVQDGLTRELMHFPGHMDEVIEEFKKLYSDFGIQYSNPVREWPVPPDQQFMDQVIVNSHAGEFFIGDKQRHGRKTTGQYLFNEGIFPSPDVKGTRWDFINQHECYPFALYNILTFWAYLPFETYSSYCRKISSLIHEKIPVAKERYLK